MKQPDITAISEIIREVGQDEIMPRFKKLVDGDIEMKGVNDPVTIADKAAEKALAARFADYHPGSVVIGEESFANDANIISHFSREHDVWVIDPIDGTRNFISGKPEFATMVALVRRRQTIAAWIHDPNTGDTLAAELGAGVKLGGNKMKLAASNDPTIGITGIIGARLGKLLKQPEITATLSQTPKIETGSAAAFDYARLFTGDALFARSKAARIGFLIYRQSKPWDHIPGLFMLSECSGYAADLLGNPYDMENGKDGLLIAANKATWQQIHTAFEPAITALLKV